MPWADPTAYVPLEENILHLVTAFTTDNMNRQSWQSLSPDQMQEITAVERDRVRNSLAKQPSPSPVPALNAKILQDYVRSVPLTLIFHLQPIRLVFEPVY